MIHLIVTEPPFLIMFLKGWIHVLFVEIIARWIVMKPNRYPIPHIHDIMAKQV